MWYRGSIVLRFSTYWSCTTDRTTGISPIPKGCKSVWPSPEIPDVIAGLLPVAIVLQVASYWVNLTYFVHCRTCTPPVITIGSSLVQSPLQVGHGSCCHGGAIQCKHLCTRQDSHWQQCLSVYFVWKKELTAGLIHQPILSDSHARIWAQVLLLLPKDFVTMRIGRGFHD